MFREEFAAHGFEIVEERVYERANITPELRSQFVEPFRAMPTDEISPLGMRFLVRRR